MPAEVPIDGNLCRVERLPEAAGVGTSPMTEAGGVIRISFAGEQFNAMHGFGTQGEYSYLVHPCQRHQYEFWNSQLPAQEQETLQEPAAEKRPWWSFGAGERATLRE